MVGEALRQAHRRLYHSNMSRGQQGPETPLISNHVTVGDDSTDESEGVQNEDEEVKEEGGGVGESVEEEEGGHCTQFHCILPDQYL